MQRISLATMQHQLLAGIIALSIIAAPAFAKDDDASATPPSENNIADAGSATSKGPLNSQVTMPSKGDNAAQSLGEMSEQAPVPALSEGKDSLAGFGPSSGTVVGNRGLELRDEVLRLRSSVNHNTNEFNVQRSSGTAGGVQYHSTVAAITARLQNGTTRGNPILLRQWDEADQALNEVGGSLSRLNSLQTAIDADASLASYLLESVQAAFQLSGAVDEDHDQLKILRDEVSRMIVQLDYLRTQITNDIERQTAYLTSERSNLQALAFAISRGELIGNSLANRPIYVTPASMRQSQNSAPSVVTANDNSSFPPPNQGVGTAGPQPMSPTDLMRESGQMQSMSPAPMSVASTPSPGTPEAGVAPTVGHLLVLIRYNQPVVDYEAQLSQAVGSALERRPNASFSVVAVSPSSGDPASLAQDQEKAQRDAEGVKRSLVQMGLSPSRISSASTQTQNASTPEVHVYIR